MITPGTPTPPPETHNPSNAQKSYERSLKLAARHDLTELSGQTHHQHLHQPPHHNHQSAQQSQQHSHRELKEKEGESVGGIIQQGPLIDNSATSIVHSHNHGYDNGIHSVNSAHNTVNNSNSGNSSSNSSCSNSNSNGTAMSIGGAVQGVQGQNPTQGLVHWMSAVMAEHMTGQTHHDPGAVGMHYMWNGNVEVSERGE